MGGRIGARMDGLNNNDGRPRNISDEDDPQIEDDDGPDNARPNENNHVAREPEREPSKDPKYLNQ
jgi:hypothetical protein